MRVMLFLLYPIILQLTKEVPDVDVAIQFLMTVAGSNREVDSRPKHNPGAAEIHQYTLQAAVGCCQDWKRRW